MTHNILILGSNSFSGAAFASKLSSSIGKHRVYRTDQLSNVFSFEENNGSIYSDTRWNLNDDPNEILNLVHEKNVNIIVNFAAQSMVGQSWEKPEDWYEANIMSFSKLVTKLSSHRNLEKFVQFSTPEVYGNTTGWIKESFNFAPNTPYAVSRAAADWHLKALHENFHFPVIFTRAANVFGERQKLYRIVPRVIFSALTGQKVPLQGGGKSVRSFIHIDDVSDALIRVIESGVPGSSYHISTNQLVTIHELVSLIAVKLNIELKDLIEVAPDRPGKDYAYQLDSQEIRMTLGWTDQISLSDGLDRVINWVQSNLEELKKIPMIYEHRR